MIITWSWWCWNVLFRMSQYKITKFSTCLLYDDNFTNFIMETNVWKEVSSQLFWSMFKQVHVCVWKGFNMMIVYISSQTNMKISHKFMCTLLGVWPNTLCEKRRFLTYLQYDLQCNNLNGLQFEQDQCVGLIARFLW